mgnify:CR=1 FL=1
MAGLSLWHLYEVHLDWVLVSLYRYDTSTRCFLKSKTGLTLVFSSTPAGWHSDRNQSRHPPMPQRGAINFYGSMGMDLGMARLSLWHLYEVHLGCGLALPYRYDTSTRCFSERQDRADICVFFHPSGVV